MPTLGLFSFRLDSYKKRVQSVEKHRFIVVVSGIRTGQDAPPTDSSHSETGQKPKTIVDLTINNTY